MLSTLQPISLGSIGITNSLPGCPSTLSAASAVVVAGKYCYVVCDDLVTFTIFPLDLDTINQQLQKGESTDLNLKGAMRRILQGTLPTDNKLHEEKPDLEAATFVPPKELIRLPSGLIRSEMLDLFPYGLIIAAGSGGLSREGKRRSQAVVQGINNKGGRLGIASRIWLEKLHIELEKEVQGPINIEGMCVNGNQLILAHRGNCLNGASTLIRLNLEKFLESIYTDLEISRWELLDVQKFSVLGYRSITHKGQKYSVPLHFTDICTIEGDLKRRMLFTAAAEGLYGSDISGRIAGSIVGLMNHRGYIIKSWEINDPEIKLEGIWGWLNREDPNKPSINMVLVADPDDNNKTAQLKAARIRGDLF